MAQWKFAEISQFLSLFRFLPLTQFFMQYIHRVLVTTFISLYLYNRSRFRDDLGFVKKLKKWMWIAWKAKHLKAWIFPLIMHQYFSALFSCYLPLQQKIVEKLAFLMKLRMETFFDSFEFARNFKRVILNNSQKSKLFIQIRIMPLFQAKTVNHKVRVIFISLYLHNPYRFRADFGFVGKSSKNWSIFKKLLAS